MVRTLMNRVLLVVAPFLAATAAQAGQFNMVDRLPGFDQPAAGRSLFDYMALSDDGKSFDVPFPLESLVARITARTGASPKAVMVPKGRSIERDRADYVQPRLVLAYDSDGTQAADDLGYAVKDHLYIGYAEKAEKLEVISYNAAAGRFDFQLVLNYAAGKTPSLVYADRGLCVKCHHNGAPIFGPVPWFETNGISDTDHKVADLLTDAMGGKQSFHGFAIATPRQVPYDIDNSTERANYMLPYQVLWTDGCGKDAADAPQCRASVLKFALQQAITPQGTFDRSSAEFQKLNAAWNKYWTANLGGGVIVPTPKMLAYDPLVPTEPNTGFPDLAGPTLPPAEAARILELLKNSQVPADVDPLYQFLPPLEVWTMNSVCYGSCVIYGIARFLTDADKVAIAQASGNDFSKVSQAIDQLAQGNDQIFGNRPFRRGIVMRALLQKIAGQVVSARGENDYPKMPAPQFDNAQSFAPNDGSPLGLMTTYCTPCHTEFSGKLGFLTPEPNASVMAKIKVEAAEIVRRLSWEQAPTPGHNFMPPANEGNPTSQRSRLTAHPQDRQTIIDYVKSL